MGVKRRTLVEGKDIRDLRQSMGLTLVDFAGKVPISRRTLIDYEQGRYGVTRLIVAKRLKEMQKEHAEAKGGGTDVDAGADGGTATAADVPKGPIRRRFV